jgi:hypothetical protein
MNRIITSGYIQKQHERCNIYNAHDYLNNFFKLSLHLLFSLSSCPPALVIGLSPAPAPSPPTFNNPPLLEGLCLLFGLASVDQRCGVCGLADTGVEVLGRSGVEVLGRSGYSSGTVSGEKWMVWRDRAEAKGVGDRAVSGERVDGRGEEKG